MEISKQLKNRLKLIEKETEFFSRTPRKPRRSQLSLGSLSILILAGIYVAFTSEDKFLLLVFLVTAGINGFSYLHQKRLFDMYSNACEIINFYKKADESKILQSA